MIDGVDPGGYTLWVVPSVAQLPLYRIINIQRDHILQPSAAKLL
jgi:hypothetical protein